MADALDARAVTNCTILAVNRFPWSAPLLYNESSISSLNITTIFGLLQDMIDISRQDDPQEDSVRLFVKECFRSATQAYELPWEQKAIWGVIFGAMLFIAITGNCIVLWIVLAHRRMRTVTNYFLLNLSVADLLMSSLNCVFNFIFMLNSDWPFGPVYCTINNFIANVSVAASVFTLVAISFDRYIAIVRPLRHRTSRKKARIFLLIIWALSGILASPCLLYSTTETMRYNGKTRTQCYMIWPDGSYPTSMADYIYNLVFLTLTYGIPMLIMIVCYSLMGKELWGSRSIGEHTERQLESMKSKKKVVRMFIIIVTIFAICWLPYQLFFVYAYHNKQVTSKIHAQQMYLAFYWLAMSNAMVNPLIYYWMNGRFRVYFQEIICYCCLRVWKAHNKGADNVPGILGRRNSQSDFARTKSCRPKSVSMQWHQTMPANIRARHLNPSGNQQASPKCNSTVTTHMDVPLGANHFETREARRIQPSNEQSHPLTEAHMYPNGCSEYS
ncbi:tachykinin-like peptides receptor 86C [Phlebotomus argentipes]|uniref:tachykinin-like peptides receptor 86C n=1 Tax=Phlebotomus argentipes TaxID=94469 RepID=UPI002892DC83|nr:tachykinin-like peptides receptor 86C [Phlebotomus argentipes]